MKLPSRCNKRACQVRRPLSKRPEQYVRWPKCHKPGCTGRMVVDEFRLRGRTDPIAKAKDQGGPTCNDYRCDHHYPHKRGTTGCFFREDHIMNMSLTLGTHKHSPYGPTEAEDHNEGEPF